MKDRLTIQQLVEEITRQSNISRKMADELVKALPQVITEGLEKDGQVRISGLGTFKLKYVKERIGHDFKTGENVSIPGHNKLVFQAEKQMSEKVNQDFRYLTYRLLNEEKKEEEKAAATPVSKFESTEATAVPEPSEPVPSKLDAEPLVEVTPPPVESTVPQQPEPPLPPPKRNKYFWVIPSIFLLIILLLVIFYFRTCRQEPEFTKSTQKESEQVLKAKEPVSTPYDSTKAEAKEAEGQQTAPAETTPEKPAAKPEKPAAKPEKTTPAQPQMQEETVTVTNGQRLFQIARKQYGNPYLWVLIYKANRDKLSDPENIPVGVELIVPVLEGSPQHLTKKDSSDVADGYQMVYDYYSAKGDDRADLYLKIAKKYKP